MAMILFYPRPPILPPLPSLELLDCVHVFSSLKSMMRKKNLLFCAPFPRPAHGPSDWDSFPLGKLPLGGGRRHGVALSLWRLSQQSQYHTECGQELDTLPSKSHFRSAQPKLPSSLTHNLLLSIVGYSDGVLGGSLPLSPSRGGEGR